MKAKDLTTGGILVALSMLCFFLVYFIPTNTLTMFTLSAFMPPIAYLMSSLKLGILVYIASSILGFILFGPQIALVYILFFGNYGIIKAFIEGSNNVFIEFILKLVYFNVMFTVGYTIAMTALFPELLRPIINLASMIIPAISQYLPESIAEILMSSVGVVDTLSTTIKLIFQVIGNILFLIFDYALSLLIWNFHKFRKVVNK
ncbi:MAG: hypothetical protein BEN18_10590 [Epulopiscium sp. Nuni2H_MBin001]|nr:MAG: hypothetical protein BEN18_10590 [Epulopiscium sp. Nuni2H_MBin001]